MAALQNSPRVISAANLLSLCYLKTGRPEQSAKIQQEVLDKLFNESHLSVEAYGQLICAYLDHGKFEQAAEAFLRQVTKHPEQAGTYRKMTNVYQVNGRMHELEPIMAEAFRRTKPGSRAHINIGTELIYCLMINGKHAQAEQILRKMQRTGMNPMYKLNIYLNYAMAGDLQAYGQNEASRIRSDGVDAGTHYLIPTISNMRRIQDIVLADKNRMMVWVQYPMRSLAPLRQAVGEGHPRVVFIDNNEIFRQAVRERGYSKIFKDHFAGNFGHCHPEGNRLLAQNIARAILKRMTVEKQ